MTIEEAIKLLRKDVDDPGAVDIMDINKAEELGIEALKREQILRREIPYDRDGLLPGETKD